MTLSERDPMKQTLTTAKETDLFRQEDLFFSRTDARGVILSANTTFQRIAGFGWDELIGAPHKLVRHPGMPRAVFHLMWQTIQAGDPLGAYVTNRTKDGEAYTVFAVAMPFEGGYISVRLKPMSPAVSEMKRLYDQVAQREADQALSPEESASALLGDIRAQGYDDYAAFMAHALERELNTRNEALGRLKLREVAALSCIELAVDTIAKEGQGLRQLLQSSGQIPYNMRLQATRLEGRDGPIGVISANHQLMSESFAQSLQDFLAAASAGAAPVRHAKFLTATSHLIDEVANQLQTESGMCEEMRDTDLQSLRRLSAYYTEKTTEAVKEVAKRARYFDRVCKDMRRMVFGLEMTRTMCKIERSKTTGDTEGLDEIVSRIQTAEDQLSEMMAHVEGAVRDIIDSADTLLRHAAPGVSIAAE